MLLLMMMMFEMVESMWLRVESSAARGENHRITVTASDFVIVVSSSAMNKLLTIADTVSNSPVRSYYFAGLSYHRQKDTATP